MPSLFRKLLTPKHSSANLKRSTKKPQGGTIKRWTSRNKTDGSSSILERTRRYLYTCPTLTSVGQINLFLRSIKRNPELAKRVKGAVLNGACAGVNRLGTGERMRGAVTTRLPQLLESCVNLQELTLKDAIVFSLTDFSHADALLHLTLDGTLLSDRTTTQRYQKFYTPLTNLSTLTLRSSEFDLSTADHFLCPRTLPAVVAVELEGCRLVDNPSTLTDLGVYEPRRLASSVELLVLKVAKNTFPTSEDLSTIAEVLPNCTNLRALEVEAAYLSPSVLETLPLSVTHLSVLVAPQPFPDLFAPNLSAAQALSTSFLNLATFASSPSSTPFGSSSSPVGRSPLSSSFTSTPLALSPFGSPHPSPPLTQTPQSQKRHPLCELIYLRLPRCWDLDAEYGWKESEFTWAVGRITKEAGRRLVRIEYAEREERTKGRVVRGRELREALEKVKGMARREEEGYLW
ncbi:uncharacterized protein JCM6883_006295 [Sporobolomyces salmoneus]|uniref:uncharacterized protein n=1 Tax=Sporobolomyces salmoneus TaxID=183962 RepID=UPI00316F23D8